MVRIGIYGATGYTGYELVKMLVRHEGTEIAFATSRTSAGKRLSDLYPCPYDVPLVAPQDASLDGVDVICCCLPHTKSMPVVAQALEAGVRVIDWSADFRLQDVAVYERWYVEKHTASHLLGGAVYGLTEVYREQIAQADLVAVPGCYPTGTLLALYPLVRGGNLARPHVIVDAKSGASGAGRSPKVGSLFVEVNEDFRPYGIGRAHRHLPEMEQELKAWGGADVRVTFSPHLLPVDRGILSTIYVTLEPGWSVERLGAHYREVYAGEPFIHVLPAGKLASLAYVIHTNRCVLSFASAGGDDYIVVAAIDNLIKGASGAALQNLNVMYGLDEGMGMMA